MSDCLLLAALFSTYSVLGWEFAGMNDPAPLLSV